MRAVLRACLLGGAFVALLTSSVVHAEPAVAECSSAYARGQQERLAGRLFTARAAFMACNTVTCASAMAADCARWQAEVEADLPTVRVKVSDVRGQPVLGLQVFADGARIPAAQLAAPLILEAGPHELRFEALGFESVRAEKALRPSDREVEILVIMHPPIVPAAPADTGTPARSIPTASVVLAGAGVVALGGALYFGLKAQGQYRDLKRDCAPLCSQSDSDSLYTKAVIADVALVTAVVAFSASAWLYFSRPAAHPATALHVQSRPGGAQLSLATSF